MKALVTGGTRGIGRASAVALLKDGYEVFVTGTSPENRAPDGCGYLECDFSDPRAVSDFAGRLQELNVSVLVNNAGINKVGALEEYDPADFARIQQVNVTTPFVLCRSVIPGMRARGYGRIVNISSIWGVVGRPGRSAYSTSKFALFGMTRALALEVASVNIMVNCLAPGFVDTELTRTTLGEAGIRDVSAQIPVGRLARPEEIANCVAFLAAPGNTYLTGQTIIVDGGFTCA